MRHTLWTGTSETNVNIITSATRTHAFNNNNNNVPEIAQSILIDNFSDSAFSVVECRRMGISWNHAAMQLYFDLKARSSLSSSTDTERKEFAGRFRNDMWAITWRMGS